LVLDAEQAAVSVLQGEEFFDYILNCAIHRRKTLAVLKRQVKCGCRGELNIFGEKQPTVRWFGREKYASV
jgi:hypothetical protein